MTAVNASARLRKASEELFTSLLAVAPALSNPYEDDPRWTPWTRFIDLPLEELDVAVREAADALDALP